jgi:ribosomal protein S18 acetylase RimI-like enzyme
MGVVLKTIREAEIPTVVEIAKASFGESAWTAETFLKYRSAKKTTFFGLYLNNQVIGYVIYHWDKWKLDIVNINISIEYRGLGYGRFIISELKKKLHTDRRRIITYVPETNLDYLNFLKHMGFLGRGIKRKFFTDKDIDAIRMSYVREPAQKKEQVPLRS